jgi:hypothetical protein
MLLIVDRNEISVIRNEIVARRRRRRQEYLMRLPGYQKQGTRKSVMAKYIRQAISGNIIDTLKRPRK